MVAGDSGAGTRRERVRDATTAEIKATARSLLVAAGPQALQMRAIAREMGMTAPALYRYFTGHEELVVAVIDDVLAEITQTLRQAQAAAEAAGAGPVDRLGAICREFRAWSLAHPREFQLVFATAGEAPAPHHEGGEADLSFGQVFLDAFVDIWAAQPFAVPRDQDLPSALAGQLRSFSALVGDVLPLGALAAYLSGWVRLYGAVTIEVFGHLGFAVEDAEPMFEAMLADLRRQLTAPPA